MEKILKFKICEEEVFGHKRWEGYKISVIPREAEKPNACLECKKWFKKGQKVHPVIEDCTRVWHDKPEDRYCAHARTYLYLDSSMIGSLCEECFHKAVDEGHFRHGKIENKIK